MRNIYIEFENCYEIIIFFKNTTVSCYIDKEDKEKVSQYNWRISQKKNKYYAVSGQSKKGTLLYMHNLLMDRIKPQDGLEVDHLDGNSLNNRKNNLRIVSRLENIYNTNARIDNKIGIRGVCKTKNKFKTDFSHNKKSIISKIGKLLKKLYIAD